MAITRVSSAVFSPVDRSEVDAFTREARRVLEIEEMGGEASLDGQAQLQSLRLKDDKPFIHYVKGITKRTRPTFILICVRMKDRPNVYVVALNTYKKQLYPKAFHFDGEESLNEWDGLTIDDIVASLLR